MHCVVPETKGKNAEEIRKLFSNAQVANRIPELVDSNNNQDEHELRKQSHLI